MDTSLKNDNTAILGEPEKLTITKSGYYTTNQPIN